MEDFQGRLTHELTMTVLMTPDMANFAGNIHGGTILKYLDSVAYACASRYSGTYVVTLLVDQVMIPVPPLELVTDERRARFEKAAQRKLSRQALHGNRR
jgi:acyl-coenzyme A thioesterase PaaI-like protein